MRTRRSFFAINRGCPLEEEDEEDEDEDEEIQWPKETTTRIRKTKTNDEDEEIQWPKDTTTRIRKTKTNRSVQKGWHMGWCVAGVFLFGPTYLVKSMPIAAYSSLWSLPKSASLSSLESLPL